MYPIIEDEQSHGRRSRKQVKIYLPSSLSARILAVGLFVQLGYHNCKILAKFYPWLIIIHLFGLQLKLLHNAYHILPTLHTIFQPRSSIIKEAKAVPHCFDMTNTIWQNQVPVIFLMLCNLTDNGRMGLVGPSTILDPTGSNYIS